MRLRAVLAAAWLVAVAVVLGMFWQHEHTARAAQLLGQQCGLMAEARYPVDANGFVYIKEDSLRWQCKGGTWLEVQLWMQ